MWTSLKSCFRNTPPFKKSWDKWNLNLPGYLKILRNYYECVGETMVSSGLLKDVLCTLLPHPWTSLQVLGVCHCSEPGKMLLSDGTVWHLRMLFSTLSSIKSEMTYTLQGLLATHSAEQNRGQGHGCKFSCTPALVGPAYHDLCHRKIPQGHTSKKLNTFFKKMFYCCSVTAVPISCPHYSPLPCPPPTFPFQSPHPIVLVHVTFVHVPWLGPSPSFPCYHPPPFPLVTASLFFISKSLVLFGSLVCFVD